MSFGASFIAANQSASFVVREIILHSEIPADLTIEINGTEEPFTQVLFEKGMPLGSKQKITVNATANLNLTFFENGQSVFKGAISGIDSIFEKEAYTQNGTTPKVSFDVIYNQNGFLEIANAKCSMRQNLWKEKT